MPPENTRLSQIRDGLIVPPTHLEVIAVDHCNITCAGCNHASPAMPAWFADPDSVYRDLSILARRYRPNFIKLLGGEPLMHKNLPALIEAIRAAGMDCKIMLVTNGTLLHKAVDGIWEGVDEIELSVYPGAPGVEGNIDLARTRMTAMGKRLNVYRYDRFRATFTLKGTEDRDLIRRIYTACKVANYWGCHGLRDGYFYKCPQSMYAGRLQGGIAESDRIAITDRPTLQAELLEFVNSPEPLAACANCLGTVGIQQPFNLPPRSRWLESIDQPSEALTDYEWLEKSLIRFDEPDDCKLRQKPRNTPLLERLPALRSIARLFSRHEAGPAPGRREQSIHQRKP